MVLPQTGPIDRVTHYAFMSAGPSFGPHLRGEYLRAHRSIYELLRQYNYPDEAIFKLTESGEDLVGGRVFTATLENYRKIFSHLSENILDKEDHVFIVIVGHGNPIEGDFVHNLVGGNLTATELGGLVNRLPTKNLTIAIHPCFSGGFIPALRGENRVIVTSTKDDESNSASWIGQLVEGLSLSPAQDRGPSIKDAYEVTKREAERQHNTANTPLEHPQLEPSDGILAANRFLGNNGRRLEFSREAVEELAKLNAQLELV
jgi:hypothetical protein